LQVNPETYEVSMPLTEAQFGQAPKGAVISSQSQAEEIYRYYGVSPRWQQDNPPPGELRMSPGTNMMKGSPQPEGMQQHKQERRDE
jgi:hypothetical protein